MSNSHAADSPARHSARLGLESLEGREVPAGLTGGFSNGVLTVNGTAGSDTITLRQSGDVVTLDGYTNRWSASRISSIQINAGAGNDTVTVSTSPQVAARLRADGGGGHDRLSTTAQPVGWYNFEVGQLISAPSGGSGGAPSGGTASGGVRVEWAGTTGPYTVSYYRRGDSAAGGELHGEYQTRAQAEQAVAGIQQWAARINNGGYWDIVRITVRGHSQPTGTQPTTDPLAALFARAQQATSRALAAVTNLAGQVGPYLDRLASAYREFAGYVRQVQQARAYVQGILNEFSQSVRNVQNAISQPFAALRSPTVLGTMAAAIRDRARWAEGEMNRLLPGELFTSLRSSLRQVLNGLYSAADSLDNLARAVRSSGGR